MQLSAPKQITFWIAVVIAVLGLLASLVSIPGLSGFAFWLVCRRLRSVAPCKRGHLKGDTVRWKK